MCEIVTAAFKARSRKAVQNHLGMIDVIYAIDEFHQWFAIATDPEEDKDCRLAAIAALLKTYPDDMTWDEIKLHLARLGPPSGDMVTLDAGVPADVAIKMSARGPGEVSDITAGGGFTSFETTVSMQTAANMLEPAQAAGVRIQADNPLIRKRLKEHSASLNILPLQETLPPFPAA